MNRTGKRLLSILLCLALVLSLVPAFGLTAMAAEPQTIYATSFETSYALDEWYALDADGDDRCWGPFYDYDGMVVPDGNCCMVSYSWDPYEGYGLWPDNWLLSPEIKIPAAGKTELQYTVFSVDPECPGEIYHVYLMEGSKEIHLWSEELMEGEDRNNPAVRTMDLSAYAGKTVQIAFRHYGSYDAYAIGLDNVKVTNTPVGKDLPFVDVPEGSFFYDAVDWAVSEGITNGATTTTFDPNGTCTRGQAVTFLWRSMGCPKPKSTTVPFVDVKPGAFYYDAVLWAVENNITQGSGANTFSPNDPCTRGQIVTFLWRTYEKPAVTGTNPFTDVRASDFYYQPVLWALQKSITQGTSANTFSPGGDCTRAQIVTFLYRAAYA